MGVLGDLATIVMAVAAVAGLFFVAKQNRYLGQQVARRKPTIHVEAVAVPDWTGLQQGKANWRLLTITVHNHADVPVQIIAVQAIKPKPKFWKLEDVLVGDGMGGRVLPTVPPVAGGNGTLQVEITAEPAAPQFGPGHSSASRQVFMFWSPPASLISTILLRGSPRLRIMYRWKDTVNKRIPIVAAIWDREASS